MGETVNLRQRRKQKARQAAEEKAAVNRAKFGQPQAARDLKAAESARADAALDGKKLEK
jgi:hypothetical protein